MKGLTEVKESAGNNLKSILTSRGNSECKDPGEEVSLDCVVVVQSANHVGLFVTPCPLHSPAGKGGYCGQ